MQVQTLLSQEHFRELSKKCQGILLGERTKGYRYEMIYFILRLLIYVVAMAIFSLNGFVFKILGVMVASFAFYAVAITGTHETRHGCFRASDKANRLWAYFFSDFWAGQSNKWWHRRHVVVHHTQTNVPSKEPSLFYYPWIQPFIYFFIAPFFVNVWLFTNSVKYLWVNKMDLTKYLLVQALGWMFHIAIFAFFIPLPWAVVCTILMRAGFAPTFMHIAVFNHIGLPELDRKPTAWLPHQTVTTRNLHKNILLDIIGGNAFIECHVEHHLFPNASNYLLAKIRPTVRAFLKEHHYDYIEEGYVSCLKNSLKNYHTIFQRNPIQVIEL